MDFFLLIIKDFSFAFCVAIGFGSLFNTPNRVLLIAGLLGGLGHALRFTLYEGVRFRINNFYTFRNSAYWFIGNCFGA